jgi:hypothetical protein
MNVTVSKFYLMSAMIPLILIGAKSTLFSQELAYFGSMGQGENTKDGTFVPSTENGMEKNLFDN